MPKRILIQCSTQVDRNAVTRKSVDGVEHIVISSVTLPDNIVMNGGLYLAEEIAKSFMSLERTLAPIEHPTDTNGLFISATDPTAIHNFYAGAFNENVRQEGGRVMVDKVINVPEALKSDRGKRLLDRIKELETNSDPRPIHTSVGVFLDVEEMDEPRTSAAGQDFVWIARNMIFDHDAILLDSVGAAQPDQGVGMAVNRDGSEMEVQRFTITDEHRHRVHANALHGISHTEIREALREAISQLPMVQSAEFSFIEEIFDELVVFATDADLFQIGYRMEDDVAVLIGDPIAVEREITFIPKTTEENDAMKELMLKALADAGLSVNADITDADLLAQYTALQAKQNSDDGDKPGDVAAAVATAVANALQPVTDELAGLRLKLNEKDDAEHNRLAEMVGNSDQFAGLDVDGAKALPVDTLKSMAANCATSHGIPLDVHVNADDEYASYEMPD